MYTQKGQKYLSLSQRGKDQKKKQPPKEDKRERGRGREVTEWIFEGSAFSSSLQLMKVQYALIATLKMPYFVYRASQKASETIKLPGTTQNGY